MERRLALSEVGEGGGGGDGVRRTAKGEALGNAINPAIAALFLVNPRLIVRLGKDRPFLEFLARFVILTVGQRDGRDLRMLLLLLDLLICLLKVNLNWFNQPNCFGRPTPRHFETFARAG